MPSTFTSRLEGLTTSVAVKAPCRVATTAAITLSGLQTIDGVALSAGDRVLVKNQSSAIDNGIWIASVGAWTRAADFDGTLDAVGGTQAMVLAGSTNTNTYWRVDGIGDVDIGQDGVTFEAALINDSATQAFTQSGSGAVARTVQDKLRDEVSVRDFGAVGDNTTDDTTAFQNAINFANSLYVGGSQLGGGVTIFVPQGRYKLGALIWKNGVSLQGEGKLVTQLRVFGDNTTLIAASADTGAQTSASNLFYGSFSDIALLSWEGANGGTPTGQVGWDAIGFSRWFSSNVYFGWGGGFTGIRVTNALPAGSGGPSQWYNTFIGCICEKHFVSTGGVGLQLGDTSSDKEQITTWTWIGGAIRGSGDGTGTGLALRSSTGSIFRDVCFESVGTAVALGSSGGTRQANYNGIIDCYFEGNVNNWIEYAGCIGNLIAPRFVTGGASSSAGTATDFDAPSAFRRCINGSDATDFGEFYAVNPATRRWKFTSGSPFGAVGIENDAGTEMILANGAASDAANTYGEFLEDDLSTNLFAFGRTRARFQAHEIIGGNSNASAFAIMGGTGAPSGAPTAARALYIRTDGGVGTTLYVWSGAGWAPVTGV